MFKCQLEAMAEQPMQVAPVKSVTTSDRCNFRAFHERCMITVGPERALAEVVTPVVAVSMFRTVVVLSCTLCH
jgi:hypothetical protein